MVGGPYGTGAKSAERAANLARMNEAALAVWRKGHVPIIGVNLALPIIAAAGDAAAADVEIMMPLSLALAERCDAFLRIGGASVGADQRWRGSWRRGRWYSDRFKIYHRQPEAPNTSRRAS